MDVEVPPEYVRSSNEELVKVSYVGENAYEPVIGTVVRSFSVDLSIIHGKIEYIAGKPFGVLLVSLKGEAGARFEAFDYLSTHTYAVERV